MTRRPAPPAQKALWGRQEPVPAPSKATPAATNDPELVASVVRAALTRGYVVIGHTQRCSCVTRAACRKAALLSRCPATNRTPSGSCSTPVT